MVQSSLSPPARDTAMPSSKLCEQVVHEKFKGLVFRGCPTCQSSCFQRLAPFDSHILDYSKSFCDLPRAAQDRDLLWMFSNCALDHGCQAVSEEHSDMEHASPTATSPSSTAPASPKANRERSQEHAELTSESDTAHTSTSSDGEPDMELKSIASGSNLKRKASPKQQSHQKRRGTGPPEEEHTSPTPT